MNSSLIKAFTVKRLILPLNQPFRTALGQHDSLENVLFEITLSDGTKGFGEAAVATHITGETIAGTETNLKIAGKKLIGKSVDDYLKISPDLHDQLPHNKAALAAVEMALLDAFTNKMNIPLWKFFGPKPNKLHSDITIVISDLEETEQSAKRFYEQGFRAFKIKIGRDMDLDLARVIKVKKTAPLSAIYLDANQGYSSDQTLKFLKNLKKYNIFPELIEQPVPKEDWEGLKRVTRLSDVPVCADESVKNFSQCVKAIKEKAVDVINIKTMKSGLIQSREIAYLSKAAGLKLMIGGMMESLLAMTCSAHMASGLGCFDFIDLDTPFFIKEKVGRTKSEGRVNTLLSNKGVYDLSKIKRGIGITP